MKHKTLIISSYAPPSIGGPQNLYNLLRDIPSESYSILTSFNNIDNTSAQKGTWLDCEYIFYDNLKKSKSAAKSQKQSETTGRSFILKLKHLMKSSPFFRDLFGIPIIFGQIMMILKAGGKTVKKQNIRKIVSISDYGPALIASYFISKRNEIPLTLFLFDIYKGNHFPFPGGILASIFEPKLFALAEKIIVTNDGTKDFYVKKYGKEMEDKIIVIYNSTFPDLYLRLRSPYEPKPPYKIIYTGKIYWAQMGSLMNLIKAVNEVNDIDVRLDIYSPSPSDYLKKLGFRDSKKVKILKPLPPQEIASVQTQADILFLPLSWNTKSPDIINTATPGKLTDYLISGRPTLIHAPASSFLVEYAKEREFAHIVDTDNVEELKKGILKLATDKTYADRLIKNAEKTFFENHSIEVNSEKFKKVFLS